MNIEKTDFIQNAKQAVLDYVQHNMNVVVKGIKPTMDNIYVVWFCKTLQNWKAMVSTNLPDNMYYEVTYNGDKKEIYLDAYKKFENKTIKM